MRSRACRRERAGDAAPKSSPPCATITGVKELKTVREIVESWALREPDAFAVLAPGRAPLTFATLLARIDQVGASLTAAGLSRTSRIAVAVPPGPGMATAVLAAAAAGACVPLDSSARRTEISEHLQITGAQALLCEDASSAAGDVARVLGLPVIVADFAGPCAGHAVEAATMERAERGSAWPRSDDVALVLLTSGTTGRPKVVSLLQWKLAASAQNIACHLQLTPADRSLVVMPLFHSHGIVGALLSSMAGGASVVCVPRWDEDMFFEWVEEFQPTWYTATPPIHRRIVERGDEYRRMAPRHQFRFVRSTSAALPTETMQRLEALFSAPLIESFGMTEWSQMVSNPLPPLTRKAGSVGLPTGVEVAVVSADGARVEPGTVGEVVIRGPNVTTKYGRAAEPVGPTDWFYTGDLGRLDPDGYLYLEGRVSDPINRGGEKVSPFEVEGVLRRHPEVADAVVFPCPHPSLGEDVAAAVVLRPGAMAEGADIRAFVSAWLSDSKLPSFVLCVPSIPRTELGKVQRRQLHKTFDVSPSYVAEPPASDVERSLVALFAAVLHQPPADGGDNFFALGGDSLAGIRVITRINRQYGIKLPPTALFRYPTARALAVEVGRAMSALRSIEGEVAAMSDDEVAAMLEAEEVPSDSSDGD